MSLLSTDTQQQVEDALIADGYLNKDTIADLKDKASKENVPFLSYLISGGGVSQEVLTKISAHINHLPYVNLSSTFIDPKVLELLPQDTAEQYMAVPLGEMQHSLVVAMLDAANVQAVDFLANKIGRPLKVYAASEEGIKRILKQYSGVIDKDVASSLQNEVNQQLAPNGEETGEAEIKKNITTIVQDSPISKTLSTILDYAAKNRASDVHIEPLEDRVKIRCRIDGILREIMVLPKNTESALVSRIKILSSLKIDEHRVPQDGNFTIKVGIKEIDLRIAISPVVWGEQVVIRLLDKTGTQLKT